MCHSSRSCSELAVVILISIPEDLYQLRHKSGFNMSSSTAVIHGEQHDGLPFWRLSSAFEPPMPPLLSTSSLHLSTRVDYDLERTPSPSFLTLEDQQEITERLFALPPDYRHRVTDACHGDREYTSWNLQLLQAEDENWRSGFSEMELQWVEHVEMLFGYVWAAERMMREKYTHIALSIEDMQAQIPETPPWRNLRIVTDSVRDFHTVLYRPHEQDRVFLHHRLFIEGCMRVVAEKYSSDILELWRRLHGFLIASECLKRDYWMFTRAANDMDRWYCGLRPPHRPRDGRPDDPRWQGRFNERVMLWMNFLYPVPSLDGELPPTYEWVAELTAEVNSQAERISLGYP